MENLLSQQILNDNTQLKWVNSVSKEINWLNNVVANAEKEENEDIVERFTFMSNIKRSSNVSCYFFCDQNLKFTIYNVIHVDCLFSEKNRQRRD